MEQVRIDYSKTYFVYNFVSGNETCSGYANPDIAGLGVSGWCPSRGAVRYLKVRTGRILFYNLGFRRNSCVDLDCNLRQQNR
jgi:hypothetical protein